MPDTPGDETPPPPAWQPPAQRLPSFTPPQYAPTEYVRPATSTPPETPRRPLSRLAIGLIVGGSALLLAAVVGSAVIVVTYISDVATGERQALGSEPAPLEGEPASPLASEPFECDELCFSEYQYLQPQPSALEFEQWGIANEGDDEWTTSVTDDHEFFMSEWESMYGAPDTCVTAFMRSPMLADISGDTDADRAWVTYDDTHTNDLETTYFQQSTRFFTNSASAVDYMVAVNDELDACREYSVTSDDYEWDAKVTRTTALDVPSDVAAIGWTEVTDYGRFYAYDVQHGNVVVRTMVTSYGGMTEPEVRDIVESVATHVSEMKPQEDY